MNYHLTSKYQHSKRLSNGKTRSLLLYFLNNILIFTQKVPFNEKADHGYNKWHYENVYLLNGYIYQTRFDNIWQEEKIYKKISRNVKYPISKKILKEIGIPNDIKIEVLEK